MFVLRKISESGVEMNTTIGDGYTLITKEANKEEFDEIKHILDEDWIYGFIVCDGGSKTLLLSSKQKAFVMTESGSTFANVSLR